jgi:hypothetical protein
MHFTSSTITLPQLSALLVSALLTCAAPLSAQTTDESSQWRWRNVPMRGMGFVTGIVIHPLPPHHLYIKTDVGGVYRFDRNQERWLPLMDAFPLSEAPALDIDGFAVAPSLPNVMVMLSPRRHPTDLDVWGGKDHYGEVWRTLDAGATWTPLGLLEQRVRVAGNGEYRGFTGERVAVDPRAPERVLVASRINGGWRRESDGVWSAMSGLPSVTPWVNPGDPNDLSYGSNTPGHTFVVFDPTSAALPDGSTSIVYLGDHASGVHRSTDGGRTWSAMPGSPQYAARAAVAKDGVLYVSTLRQAVGPDAGLPEIGGIHRFTPGAGGGVWADVTPRSQFNPNAPDVRPYAGVSPHPLRANWLVAAVSGGHDKFVSFNRGANWTRISDLPLLDQPAYFPPPTPQNYTTFVGDWGNAVVAFDPARPRSVWCQNGFGVIRTDNVFTAQPSWRWIMNNLEELVMHTVLTPPVPFSQGGADLLSACMDMMGFRHERNDAEPTARIGQPLLIGQAQGLAYSGGQPDHAAFVGWDTWQPWNSLTGRSSDNGRTWTPFADTSPGIAGRIAVSASNPLNLVWEPSQWRQLKVSFDGGASWQGAVDLDATFDPNNPNWQSVGAAWHVSNPWWQGAHLIADRVIGSRFYRFTWGQWWSSSDGGLTWERGFTSWALGDQAPPAFSVNSRLVPHPTRGGEVWIAAVPNLGTEPSALFRTTDGGASVQRIASVRFATHVAFGKSPSATSPAIYMVGTPLDVPPNMIGVYRSLDEGATWTRLSDPSERTFQRAAAMDGDMRVEGRVYVAMSGRGIFVGEFVGP